MNVTWRRFRVTVVTVEGQYIFLYSECVFVATVIQHAMRKRCNVFSSVACLVLSHFPTLSH